MNPTDPSLNLLILEKQHETVVLAIPKGHSFTASTSLMKKKMGVDGTPIERRRWWWCRGWWEGEEVQWWRRQRLRRWLECRVQRQQLQHYPFLKAPKALPPPQVHGPQLPRSST